MLRIPSYQETVNPTVRQHPTPLTAAMASIKNTTITKAGKDVETRKPFQVVGGNANQYVFYGAQYGGSSEN